MVFCMFVSFVLFDLLYLLECLACVFFWVLMVFIWFTVLLVCSYCWFAFVGWVLVIRCLFASVDVCFGIDNTRYFGVVFTFWLLCGCFLVWAWLTWFFYVYFDGFCFDYFNLLDVFWILVGLCFGGFCLYVWFGILWFV